MPKLQHVEASVRATFGEKGCGEAKDFDCTDSESPIVHLFVASDGHEDMIHDFVILLVQLSNMCPNACGLSNCRRSTCSGVLGMTKTNKEAENANQDCQEGTCGSIDASRRRRG